ncbi:MAG: DUF1302 family protein, partial [Pseudomonadota bacterium]|nr:DUF1302 family protein [Pseudomonadota bacterium]
MLAVAGNLLALVCAASPVQAATFKLMDGAISGSFDTTIGWGMSLRTSTQETRENTISAGNRIYDKWDIFTNTIKASHDLELVGDGWGVFVRGNYFYDKEADDRDQYDAARNRSVHHGDITDAYIWTRFGPSEQFTVRLGKQVISWGESTFIGGNLNDINTVDITKLRVPGVELKDAFVGTPAIHFAWQATDSLSVELFNLFTFDETKFDVSGSFFMTNDWISDGGGFDASDGVIGGSPSLGQVDNTLGPANTGAGFVPSPPLPPIGPPVAQFGAFGNLVAPWAACEPIDSAPAGAVSFPPFPTCSFVGSLRSADDIPNGSDQWGIAFRYYAANLLNGIEFGLFFERLHDHNGLASGYVGPNLLDGSRV